jgi:hypothetical protein
MRTIIAAATVLSLLAVALPGAAAEPQCLQVYPWSELCEGDVGGFLEGMGVGTDLPCSGKDCVSPPPVECIQAQPWSDLCGGDVVGFVCYYLQCDVTILA